MVNNCKRTTINQLALAYLVINHLLRFVVLPQHGEELNDIGILGSIGDKVSWEYCFRTMIRTSSSN